VVQNIPLTDIAVDDFVTPVTLTIQTRFLNSHSRRQGNDAAGFRRILFLTATPGA